ncbi:hypothetical protein NPIL_46641 [Nephila pilipes]|uniref:Uncharacterized protein n=1 Tax=Nephila pilipes TaxID=299642 RepID=A0A8X6PKT2_NEPPI|nr:hypothetical protein NPIL_46641 [Nephila pilipes]
MNTRLVVEVGTSVARLGFGNILVIVCCGNRDVCCKFLDTGNNLVIVLMAVGTSTTDNVYSTQELATGVPTSTTDNNEDISST